MTILNNCFLMTNVKPIDYLIASEIIEVFCDKIIRVGQFKHHLLECVRYSFTKCLRSVCQYDALQAGGHLLICFCDHDSDFFSSPGNIVRGVKAFAVFDFLFQNMIPNYF